MSVGIDTTKIGTYTRKFHSCFILVFSSRVFRCERNAFSLDCCTRRRDDLSSLAFVPHENWNRIRRWQLLRFFFSTANEIILFFVFWCTEIILEWKKMKERDKPFLVRHICVSLSTCFFFFFFFSSNLHRDVGKEIIFYSISVLFFTGCYLYCGSRSGGLAPYSRFAGRLTA